MSRAVVREAIARLRAGGYVETRQGAGAFVPAGPGRLSFRLASASPVGREDLAHIVDAAIQGGTDGSEADDRLHVAIAAATRNPPLRRFVEFLRHQFGAPRRPTWSPDGHRAGEPRVAQREHERVFAAIRAGNASAARRAAHGHLRSSARRLGLVDVRCT